MPWPGAAWVGLQLNHWYRIQHTISWTTNQWLETSITDLHTNTTSTVSSTTWYMTGGAAPSLALPTDHRFFVGGAAGNAMAIDNYTVTVVPEPATFLALGAGIALLALRRRR